MHRTRPLSFLVLFSCLASCLPRPVLQPRVPPPGTPPRPSRIESFLDLQPGWRLQAVMGLQSDGSVGTPQVASSQQEGLNLTLSTKGVVGFATDTYSISPKLRLRFSASERSIEGKTSPAKQPALPLFTRTPHYRHLRLLYLLQASTSNHNMALLSAATPFEMNALTQLVESDPDKWCITSPRSHCQWIPTGVALRAEKPGPQPNTWLPAR